MDFRVFKFATWGLGFKDIGCNQVYPDSPVFLHRRKKRVLELLKALKHNEKHV